MQKILSLTLLLAVMYSMDAGKNHSVNYHHKSSYSNGQIKASPYFPNHLHNQPFSICKKDTVIPEIETFETPDTHELKTLLNINPKAAHQQTASPAYITTSKSSALKVTGALFFLGFLSTVLSPAKASSLPVQQNSSSPISHSNATYNFFVYNFDTQTNEEIFDPVLESESLFTLSAKFATYFANENMAAAKVLFFKRYNADTFKKYPTLINRFCLEEIPTALDVMQFLKESRHGKRLPREANEELSSIITSVEDIQKRCPIQDDSHE